MKKLGVLLICFALLAQLGTMVTFAESEIEVPEESMASVTEENSTDETQNVEEAYTETDTYIIDEIGVQLQFPKGTPVNTKRVLKDEEEVVISASNSEELEEFFGFGKGFAIAELYGTDIIMKVTMRANALPEYENDIAYYTDEQKEELKQYLLHNTNQHTVIEVTIETITQSEEVYGGITYIVTRYMATPNTAGSIQYATVKNGNLYCFLVIATGGQENVERAEHIAAFVMQHVTIQKSDVTMYPFVQERVTLAMPMNGYVFTPDMEYSDPLFENITYALKSKIRYSAFAEPSAYAAYADKSGLWFLSFKVKVLPAYRAYTSFAQMGEEERANAVQGLQNATIRSKAEYAQEFVTVEHSETVYLNGIEYIKTVYNIDANGAVQQENLVQYATFVNGTFYMVECYAISSQLNVALVETETVLEYIEWEGYYTPQLALLAELDSIGLRVRVPGRFWQTQQRKNGEEWDYNSDLFLLGWDNSITPSISYNVQELLTLRAEINYQSKKLVNMNTLTAEEQELILSDLTSAPVYIPYDYRGSEKGELLNSGFIETEQATFIFTEVLYQDTEPWSDAQYEYRLFFSTVVNGVEYRIEFISQDKNLYQYTREEVLQMVQSMAFTAPVLDEDGNIYVAPPAVPEKTIEEKTTNAVRNGLVIGPIIGLALAAIILMYFKKKTSE